MSSIRMFPWLAVVLMGCASENPTGAINFPAGVDPSMDGSYRIDGSYDAVGAATIDHIEFFVCGEDPAVVVDAAPPRTAIFNEPVTLLIDAQRAARQINGICTIRGTIVDVDGGEFRLSKAAVLHELP